MTRSRITAFHRLAYAARRQNAVVLHPVADFLGLGCGGKSILVYGDSISAAYGMAQDRGWVALLASGSSGSDPIIAL
jgi:lysophospholipase L1-like esterase